MVFGRAGVSWLAAIGLCCRPRSAPSQPSLLPAGRAGRRHTHTQTYTRHAHTALQAKHTHTCIHIGTHRQTDQHMYRPPQSYICIHAYTLAQAHRHEPSVFSPRSNTHTNTARCQKCQKSAPPPPLCIGSARKGGTGASRRPRAPHRPTRAVPWPVPPPPPPTGPRRSRTTPRHFPNDTSRQSMPLHWHISEDLAVCARHYGVPQSG